MDFQPGSGRYAWRLWGVGFIILLILVTSTDAQGMTITITPGQNITQIANNAPAGATVLVQAGYYRLTGRINPKDNQTFIAQGDVTLSGSKPVTDWSRSGQYWVAKNQTQENPPKTVVGERMCEDQNSRCNYREVLYFNRVPLEHVNALNLVKPGKWFFDYAGDAIYTVDDPTGVAVETSVIFAAFGSAADNVIIDGFKVEMFATPLENAAVEAYAGGHGWQILNNVIELNAAVGAVVRQGGVMRGNTLRLNGQAGYGAGADSGSNNATAHGVVICGNWIEANNFKKVFVYFSSGGGKIVRTTDALVCDNTSVNNYGTGLWSDLYNVRTKYFNNIVTGNATRGIYHELGYSASIVGNILSCNGSGNSPVNANILLTNVSDVQITGNKITVCSGGHGIMVRKDGGRDLPTEDIDVCGNVIEYLYPSGMSGQDAYSGGGLGRVLWCNNSHGSQPGLDRWYLDGRGQSLSYWLARFPTDYLTVPGSVTPTPTEDALTAEPIPRTPTLSPTPSPTVSPTNTPTAPAETATPSVWWIFEIRGWPGAEQK